MTHVGGRTHDILLVALIALRPLVWSGDAGAWDNLAWLSLAIGALVWLVIDAWRGRVASWRFGIGGILAAFLLLVLFPAALRSPYPSTGMGLWGMAVIHLAFAAYLMQVIPGRERLAFGALAGALVIECLVALGQWAWVLPGMTNALAGGDPAIAALENSNGDLANRVTYGGLFGTFTLANTLAAFLLLAAVPLVGVLFAGRGHQRWIAGGVLILAAVVAVGTASKGAAVALILSAALMWTLYIHGRLRWLAVIAVVIGGTAIAVIPTLRDLGAASAHVRLGYWQGASTLVAEAPLLGHGINGFAAHGARAMPLDAEPTRHVHNDVLEAAVDGGVLAGLVMLSLLAWGARRRLVTTAKVEDHSCDVMRTWRAAWPLLLFFPVFSALGMLASNVGWWPLGAGDMTWWLWPALLSGVAIAVAMLITRMPLPPPWAWQLAFAAFALHCLVDFNLQSPGIWGTMIVVGVLAGGRTYALGVCTISRSVVTVLVLGCLVGFCFGVRRAAQIGIATNTIAAITKSFSSTEAPDSRGLFGKLYLIHATRWPSDMTFTITALQTIPPGENRLIFSNLFAGEYPWSSQLHELHAQDCVAVGDWTNAVAAMRRAIAQNPAYLPRRQRLVELLELAAQASPTNAAELRQSANEERLHINDLALIVHPRNRLKPPSSALPVQPAP